MPIVAMDRLSPPLRAVMSWLVASLPNFQGLPLQQLSVLAFCRLSEPIAFSSITSYSLLMIRDIHGDDNASFYSGLLITAFAGAEACTSWIWGDISDRVGRKPIILVALAGTALSSILFGFSKHFWLAFATRVFGGAINGNVAVMQTMVTEIVDNPAHEPMAYAMQPFVWTAGSIAGAALGGFAAQPARFQIFKGTIFDRFPYLLPNVVSAVIMVTALVVGWVFLTETRKVERKVYPRDSTDSIKAAADEKSVTTVGEDESTLVEDDIGQDKATRSSSDLLRLAVADEEKKALVTVMERNSTNEVESTETFTGPVFGWMASMTLMSYHQMAFAAILPIYLLDGSAGLSGGLGQTLPQVGKILAIQGGITLGAQAMIYPIMSNLLGIWHTTWMAMALAAVPYILAPFVTYFPHGIWVVLVLQSLATTTLWPQASILLKNCTSVKNLGRVNGLTQSCASLARTAAAPLVGIIYAKLGAMGGWWSAGIFAVLGLVQMFFMKRPRNTS